MTTTFETGVSSAARYMDQSRVLVQRHRRDTVTFSRQLPKQSAFEAFFGREVSFETYETVIEVIDSLPVWMPMPDVLAEPDGDICLEWYVHPRRIVTVSIRANGVLNWAALIGNEDRRGSYRFIGEFPIAIRDCIAMVFQK